VTPAGVPLNSLPEEVRERVRAAAASTVLEVVVDTKAAKAFAKAQRKAKHEERLEELRRHLAARGIVPPVREWRFAEPAAGWLFDLAWPEARVAVEIDGGFFAKGGSRHGMGEGAREDLAKRNAALLLGWRLIHVLPENVGKSATAELILLAHRAAAGSPLESPRMIPDFILADRVSARRAARKARGGPVKGRKRSGGLP
jgi:very-short-patch-repair endonuclease